MARLSADPDVDLEAECAARIPALHRKRLGQYFTPAAVARSMVAWALQPGATSFLDPACGPGRFLLCAARAAEARRQRLRLQGCEIDPVLAKLAAGRIQGAVASGAVSCASFLDWPLSDCYDAIACNPPYVRHRSLALPAAAWEQMDRLAGARVSRTTNLYGLFIIRIWHQLAPGGRAAVIVPAEFLNADFGTGLKRFLLAQNALDAILEFSAGCSVFEGILTTACILLLRRGRQTEEVRLAHLDGPNALPAALAATDHPGSVTGPGWRLRLADRSELSPEDKWSPVAALADARGSTAAPAGFAQILVRRPSTLSLVPLAQLARVMRGIATGANHFFTLSHHEAQRRGLLDFTVPCVTRSQHLPGPLLDGAAWQELERTGARTRLLQFAEPLSPAARAHILWGEEHGLHRRYLTHHRIPWFATEHRHAAPILAAAFGRGRLRFVFNSAGILNLTAFHCIYPKCAGREHGEALMAYLASATGAQMAASEMRYYGDGLLKMEPRDVSRIRVPDLGASGPLLEVELAAAFRAYAAGWTAGGAQADAELDDRVRAALGSSGWPPPERSPGLLSGEG